MKGKSFVFILGVVVLLGVLLFGGFRFWQSYSLENDLFEAKKELSVLRLEFNQLEAGNVFGVVAAKRALNEVDAISLKWSEVIEDINEVIADVGVNVLAYSGSGGSEISLNVSTEIDARDPYFDVADFIAAFEASDMFADNFVPSIASGLSPEGKEVLSFSFSTKYLGEDLGFEEETPVIR